MPEQEYLVIGASGKTGSRVARMLRNYNRPTRLASRSSDVTFDWNDPSNWSQVLSNIKAAYVTYFPDLALPQAPGHIREFCRIARQQGVSHITLLSGRGEDAARECEDIVTESGLNWTIIRASWFAQNFTEGLFAHFLRQGYLSLPVNGVKEPFIDIDDIAEIAFSSLVDARHQKQLYEVTGPELLSFADIVRRMNKLFGSDIQFKSVNMQDFCLSMTEMGADSNTVSMLEYLFSEVLDGRNEYATYDVARALGRPAKSFDQFLIRNRHAFA